MSDDELLKIRNFGEKSLTELRDKLAERGIASERTEAMEAGGSGEPVAVLEPSGALEDLSSDDIGELLGGGTVTMANPEMAEQSPSWPEADDGEDDGEEHGENDDEEENY